MRRRGRARPCGARCGSATGGVASDQRLVPGLHRVAPVAPPSRTSPSGWRRRRGMTRRTSCWPGRRGLSSWRTTTMRSSGSLQDRFMGPKQSHGPSSTPLSGWKGGGLARSPPAPIATMSIPRPASWWRRPQTAQLLQRCSTAGMGTLSDAWRRAPPQARWIPAHTPGPGDSGLSGLADSVAKAVAAALRVPPEDRAWCREALHHRTFGSSTRCLQQWRDCGPRGAGRLVATVTLARWPLRVGHLSAVRAALGRWKAGAPALPGSVVWGIRLASSTG